MQQEDKKCSFVEHEKIKANFYCQECKIYMCNKCENFHSKLLQNHHTCNLDKNIDDIFTGMCKEKNHFNSLKYFCRYHNQLCCAACISKIEDEENGQHSRCDIYPIEEIADEKKIILKDNIQYLENLSNNIEQEIQELKNNFNKINKDKEEFKIKIQKTFTKIRNEINEREDQFLLEIDKYFDGFLFKEDFIKQSEKLPKQINEILEKGKIIDNKWKENNKLESIVNDCINIENNIKEIKEINANVEKNKKIDFEIKFFPEENEINHILYSKLFGRIYNLQIKEINNLNENEIPRLFIIPPVIYKRAQPVIHKEIQPIIREIIKPVIRKEIIPVIRQKIQPVIHKEIQPVIRQEIQPVINNEIKPIVNEQDQQIIYKEIQDIFQKKK